VSLCERCRAELAEDERLPPPWFDHAQHQVGGVALSPSEWRVLEVLWRRRGCTVATDSLMALLYDSRPDEPPDDKIIVVYICRLRAALDHTPYSIRTLHGEGYELLTGKVSGEPLVGEAEDGVPLPARERPPANRDKYGLRTLQEGQSRKIGNAKLATLHAACRYAARRGWGRFAAAPDERGELRIWRLE
jgi:DNA-binding winged helix-turn-helix (wHTH) protein